MLKYFICSIITISLTAQLAAGELTALQIMSENETQMESQSEKASFTMKLINKRGKARNRDVVLYSKKDQDNQERSVLKFKSPSDVKGVTLLSVDEGENEYQWLYLPALKRVRRISSNEKRDSFMGSDFSYEDIEDNELEDFQYAILGEENINGINCYHLLSTPISEELKSETAYSKTEMWIDKNSFLTIQAQFYDHKGELSKKMTAGEFKTINDSEKVRPHLLVMENLKTGHKTVLEYDNIEIDIEIDNQLFEKRNLERGK